MAIGKPLTPSPIPQQAGLPGLNLEIGMEPDLVTPLDDGGVLVQFGAPPAEGASAAHGDNLATLMDDNQLNTLAGDLIQSYEADKLSRRDWEKTYMKGLDLLGLKFEERTKPWDGACGVFHPMLAEAVVRFQAQTIQEIFPAKGPVKTHVVGTGTEDKIRRATRVQDYLNYLLTEEMAEYRGETEKLLFSLPLAGSAFRKIYFDQALGRPASMFVPAEDLVVSYGAADLKTCERVTHVMKRTQVEVLKAQKSGFYRDIELPTPRVDLEEVRKKYEELTGTNQSVGQNLESRHTLLEMQVHLNLEGFEEDDEIPVPYVVTIEKDSRKILSIYRNWKEGDPLKLKREHFVHYEYIPGLGFYGFGLVHLIGGLSKSATSLLRQLVDAGTLANLPGGLKARGLRIKGDDKPIEPGEFRDVDVPGGSIKDNIMTLPYKEPSATLYTLLADLVQEGRRFASAADLKAAQMNAEAPVGTTLAILEREMKVLSAVQARIHASVRRELKILSGIVKDHGPTHYPYEVEGEPLTAEDFSDEIDIIPVSDPNAGTMAQRIMQYQAALQLAAQAPQIYELPKLHRQMLNVLGLSDAHEIVPLSDDIKPMDPITENMNLIRGTPVRAFMYQDHEAHLTAHIAALEDPKLMSIMQMDPQAQIKHAALMAHVAEHVAFQYRAEIEKQLGVPLPGPEEQLPEDIEVRLSRLVAPAAAQLTGKDQREAAAQKAMEEAQDPVIQMQMRELDIEAEKVRNTAAAEMAKLDLKRQELAQKGRLETAKLGVEIAKSSSEQELESKRIASTEQVEAARMGTEIAKTMINSEAKQQKGPSHE